MIKLNLLEDDGKKDMIDSLRREGNNGKLISFDSIMFWVY
jgi:hypothetical protein